MEAIRSKFSPLQPYFGDFTIGSDFLDSKPDLSPWFVIKIIDAILRGIAQVCFANNPVSGLLILIGLGLGGIELAIGGIVGPFVAIITCLILDQPMDNIKNGLYQFNACLVGTVVPSLYPLVYGGDLGYMTWIIVVVMSAMSVPIQSGLANILSSLNAPFQYQIQPSLEQGNVSREDKTEQPEPRSSSVRSEPRSLVGLTFPFNVTATIAMFCLVSFKNSDQEPSSSEHIPNDHIDWALVFRGILVSSGQVYAALTPIGSVLTYLGLAVYSPYLAFVSVIGAAIGSFTALLFHSMPYSFIYDGIWGYCPILTAGALGCTFYEQNVRTTVMWILACIFTTGLQNALIQTIGTHLDMPIFTLPFVLTTWLFMILNSQHQTLLRR